MNPRKMGELPVRKYFLNRKEMESYKKLWLQSADIDKLTQGQTQRESNRKGNGSLLKIAWKSKGNKEQSFHAKGQRMAFLHGTLLSLVS